MLWALSYSYHVSRDMGVCGVAGVPKYTQENHFVVTVGEANDIRVHNIKATARSGQHFRAMLCNQTWETLRDYCGTCMKPRLDEYHLRSSMGFSFLGFRIARFFHRFRSLQRSRSLMLCVVLRAVSSSHFQPSDSCFTVTQSLIRLVLTKQNARKESSEKDEEQKEKPKDKDSIWHSSASHKLLITIYSNTFLWFSLHSLCMASGS